MGIAGERIPISARIVILADIYDALTSTRCYKVAFSHTESKAMVIHDSGKVFDPLVVECFFQCEDAINEIRTRK